MKSGLKCGLPRDWHRIPDLLWNFHSKDTFLLCPRGGQSQRESLLLLFSGCQSLSILHSDLIPDRSLCRLGRSFRIAIAGPFANAIQPESA